MILCKNDKLTIRSLEFSDKNLLVKWLTDSKVLKYYEGRDNPHSAKKVEEKFYDDNVNKKRFIIEYYQTPIGYIQYYMIDEKEREEYGFSNFVGKIFGTDQFIGETNYLGQGIGKNLMKLMIEFLSTIEDTQKIVLDPQTWNTRAIKCYENSGFIKVKLLPNHELHEGELKDCWLMEYDASNTKK